ncbi:TRAUB-domain-containing protein [Paxillus ammoniavirescens]|nr:TRAUB-domain-containing protein [Paxillus ammoniavirescens]
MERLSLAQQIAQLEDVAPAGKSFPTKSSSRTSNLLKTDFDPEDVHITGADPDKVIEDNSAPRAHYIDVGPSALRKLQDRVSDPKYDGVTTSRKELMDDDDDDDDDDSNSGEDEEPDLHGQVIVEHEPPSSEQEEDHRSDHEVEVSTIDASITRPRDSDQNEDLSSTLRKTREEDRKKGKAISKQIALWDSLLDGRIRLQKSVTAGNRLPSLCQYADNEDVQASLSEMLDEARRLSDELLDFQESLLSTNESIQPPPRKRRRTGNEKCLVADSAEGLREASQAASLLQCIYHPHLIQTLNKWSSKIQAVAPSVLLPSNRNAFSKSNQHIKSAAQLIDETLADHTKVLARTRIYRGKSARLDTTAADGGEDQEQEDPEIFDDTDFYHQLLRDVIDSRGSGSSGNDDWVAMQKQKKAKKKVDTKASKGRKLRYEVHEKIQNFMVPVAVQGSWHEEQIDELFASLLGKGFESAMQEVGEVATDGMETLLQEQVDSALKGGFRVFG